MRKIIYILAFFYSGLISYAQIAVDCSDPFESADSLVELSLTDVLSELSLLTNTINDVIIATV